jgi:plasmid replication initiation protein
LTKRFRGCLSYQKTAGVKTVVKAVKKYIYRFLGQSSKIFGVEEIQEVVLQTGMKVIERGPILEPETEENPAPLEAKKQDDKQTKKKVYTRRKKPKDGEIVTIDPIDIRDIMELMEFPFLALSKNRTAPINYENSDGSVKVRISGHPPHYVASVYDWDIVLFVASKMQEIINSQSDIPPRTLIVPRYELLKALHKHDGKKEEKDLRASLSRLKLTGIETTIRNEDGRYDAGFGFLDSWGYTDRKDVREFRITLSQWLYDGICRKGSLLKVRPEYFKITSGFKKFLYRTARKHVGNQNKTWEFSIETLYEKSGSEQEFKKFKYKLKKAVEDNDIPAYSTKWIEEDGKEKVRFISKKKEIEKLLSEF